MRFDRESRVLYSHDSASTSNTSSSKDTPRALRLEINKTQEGPNVELPEELEQYLKQVLRICWDWTKERIHYKDTRETDHPNLLLSIFPEAEHIMSPETREALGISCIKVSTRIVGRRRYKKDDSPLSLSNTPAIALEISTNVTTPNETLALTRYVTCYLTGNPELGTLQEAYYLKISNESDFQKISGRAAAQAEPRGKTIFQEFEDKVTENHQGFEQIQLETWDEMQSLISRAVEEVGLAIMRGLDIPFPPTDYDARFTRLLNSFKSVQKADNPNSALTALKNFIYRKIPGCTWTINDVEYFITQTTNINHFEGENFTTPRFAFSILVNIFSNKKYVGTIARDFEIGARYDEISEAWQVYTSITQTPQEITDEFTELKKDWNRKSYIGQRLEERNMRTYFQSPMSPYQS